MNTPEPHQTAGNGPPVDDQDKVAPDGLGKPIVDPEAELERLRAECQGYQRLAEECRTSEGKTVVVLIHGDHELRIFGPTADREKTFAEEIAHYHKLLHVVAGSLAAADARSQRDNLRDAVKGIRKWAASLIPGNIEAQIVVNELDAIIEDTP